MVAVGAHAGVVERHLQLVHGLQEQPLTLVLQVLEGGFLPGVGGAAAKAKGVGPAPSWPQRGRERGKDSSPRSVPGENSRALSPRVKG